MGENIRTWVNAKDACQNNNASLVSIPDKETASFLKNRISLGVPFWTGGKPCNGGSGSWCWLDDTAFTFTNWRDSCPKSGSDQRLRVDTKGDWCSKPRDDSEWKYNPICQYKYDPDDIE